MTDTCPEFQCRTFSDHFRRFSGSQTRTNDQVYDLGESETCPLTQNPNRLSIYFGATRDDAGTTNVTLSSLYSPHFIDKVL